MADLSSMDQVRRLADEANDRGPFDAVIHNAGVGSNPRREVTEDGLEEIFQVNVLAPYVLTALMDRPGRLVYLSSGLHQGGSPELGDIQHQRRRWDGMQAYADSKLLDAALAFIVAGFWRPDMDTGSPLYQVLYFFSVPLHFDRAFTRGVIDVRPLVLYTSMTLFCLFLTVRSLERRRWS